jgi:hypothetical protein
MARQLARKSLGSPNVNRLCILAVVAVLPVSAQAASLHGVQQGARLEVGIACARQIDVVADPALSGQAVMDAVAANQEEIAQIVLSGGDAVRVKARGQCWRGPNPETFEPTLDITLHVPALFPLGIDAAGRTVYHVTAGGTLALDQSGSGEVDATKVTKLDMDLSGSGTIRVLDVAGPISLDLSGSAKVMIKQAQSDTLDTKISGSGHVRIESGTIGRLSADGSGSGDVTLGGEVGTAAVDLSGSGSVSIGKLTGKLTQDISGSGEVHVLSH